MILKAGGKAYNITDSIVGRVTFNEYDENYDILINPSIETVHQIKHTAVISTSETSVFEELPYINATNQVSHLKQGDIVVLNSDGVINTIYRINSRHNFLLFTERCNSNCLMCSQPPKDRDDTTYFFDLYKKTIPLIPKDCICLGITGGEPTLMGGSFFLFIE